ncbi:MAG: threonine synthase [Clostridiales bacterium]|nr:threonine synthase [Clostridiales bacterium]
MLYLSTRDNDLRKNSMDVIKEGISLEGGLFVPEFVPMIKEHTLMDMVEMDYRERAIEVLSLYLTDFNHTLLKDIINSSYNNISFDSAQIAPIVSVGDNLHILELWHGPTYAFKDMALQILPRLMSGSVSATGESKELVILVATSGDTGKAALEGFKDVAGIQIIVFYPEGGVSPIQRLQMVTQEGKNVHVAAVEGNFDDTQSGVKQIFANEDFIRNLAEKGKRFSSANSINWGRLVPQIVYYVSAYIDLIKAKSIEYGEEFNVVVPTGNFGNILAAYYAKKMGIPIGRLICASNSNNILTDFINTGVYDVRRNFYKTMSPSMDILISSNLERLLFELCGRNDEQLKDWMCSLNETGIYKVDEQTLKELQSIFWGGFADEEETSKAIRNTYNDLNYIMDPHTAVGKYVYDEYRTRTGDRRKTLLVSTASPFKFPGDVLKAIRVEKSLEEMDDFQVLESLSSIVGQPIPAGLANLKEKAEVHKTLTTKGMMGNTVKEFLGLDE